MNARPDNWPDLLVAHFDEWKGKPFIWGVGDCGHFAASWMQKMGYVEPLAGLPSWTSPLSAYRLFNRLGGLEHTVQAQMKALGCDEIPARHPGRGNVVLAWIDERRQALGISNGRGVAVRMAGVGIAELPVSDCALRAWRI